MAFLIQKKPKDTMSTENGSPSGLLKKRNSFIESIEFSTPTKSVYNNIKTSNDNHMDMEE